MSSIRKTVLSGGREHYIQIDSSLDLEEIEVTGCDPISGKTVHVSLSSLLKQPTKPILQSEQTQPLDMFGGESEEISEEARPATYKTSANEESDNNDNVINDLFD